MTIILVIALANLFSVSVGHTATSPYAGTWVISGQSDSTEFIITSDGVINENGITVYVPYARDNGFGDMGSATNRWPVTVDSSGFSFLWDNHVGSECGSQDKVSATFSDENTLSGSASASQWCYDSFKDVWYTGSGSRNWTAMKKDIIPPTVTSFTIPPTSSSPVVPISNFTATDDIGITGYLITETAATPLSYGPAWSATVPQSYSFTTSQGSKILYAWVKDAWNNVSTSLSAPIEITLNDNTPPTVVDFAIPQALNNLKVDFTNFTATDDNIFLTGYLISESATAPLATSTGWSATAPQSYTFTSPGDKILYAWVKDIAGNVSAAKSASILIDLTAPAIASFHIPETSHSYSVPVISLLTDDSDVTGYMITEGSNVAPSATATGWSTAVPESFEVSFGLGIKCLYAWVKDATGNVSASRDSYVEILESVQPVITSFLVPATSNNLSIPITSLTATDNVAVRYYEITESSLKPTDFCRYCWSDTPTYYWATGSGLKTLYAWAWDSAGNVSESVSATVMIEDTPPTITSFTIPSTSKIKTIPITAFTATDNIGIQEYCITTVDSSSNCTWWSFVYRPGIYTFDDIPVGVPSTRTLYAWVRDAAGNVAHASATVVITIPTFPRIIAASSEHTLTVRSDGTVWAWGSNSSGQLGDGTYKSQTSPVPVSGLNGVISVAAGERHSLALKDDGTVWVWGYNSKGLGDGSLDSWPPKTTPVTVSGLTGVVAIAARNDFSLALKSDGTVWAWGGNSYGQLGDGTTTSRTTPVQVSGLGGVTGISAGGSYNSFAAALKNDGTVWAWGDNGNGQLGDGTTTSSTTPIQVIGLTDIRAISAGSGITALNNNGSVYKNYGVSASFYSILDNVLAISAGLNHTIALRSDSTVWTWGDNSAGQLGDGTTQYKGMPRQLGNLGNIISIAAGTYDSFALQDNGTLWGWGQNDIGQLGIGRTSYDQPNAVQSPVRVDSLPNIASAVVSDSFSAAIANDGSVWSWGNNSDGQLGDGTRTSRATPVQVTGLNGVSAIAVADDFVVTVKNDGTVWSWGANWPGQLGDGTTTSRTTPVQVTGLNGGSAIAVGNDFVVAIKNDGSVWSWGDNWSGQLGDGTTTSRTTPVQVTGLNGVSTIAVAYNSVVAVKNDGAVWSWGDNWSGQLGDGTKTSRATPGQVIGLSGVSAVSVGFGLVAALKSDGTVWEWGTNTYEQLAPDATSSRTTPAQVAGLSGVTAVSVGGGFVAALKNDGTVWAWGYNDHGELGDGTTTSRTTPVQVSGLNGVIALSAQNDYVTVLKNDGTVWEWGQNPGDPLLSSIKTVPVQVSNLTQVNRIITGQLTSFAVKNDGTIWGWGWNGYGQIGNGYAPGAPLGEASPMKIDFIPVKITGFVTPSTSAVYLCQYWTSPPAPASLPTVLPKPTTPPHVTGVIPCRVFIFLPLLESKHFMPLPRM